MLDKVLFVYQAWRVPDSLGCGNLEFPESSGLELSSGGRGEPALGTEFRLGAPLGRGPLLEKIPEQRKWRGVLPG